MVTLGEKVYDIWNEIYNNVELVDEYADIRVKEIIRLALKKQDRDTRHACAEAVNAVDISSTMIGYGTDIDAIKAQFHSTVMNCRGGLEDDGNQHEKKAQRIVRMIKEIE